MGVLLRLAHGRRLYGAKIGAECLAPFWILLRLAKNANSRYSRRVLGFVSGAVSQTILALRLKSRKRGMPRKKPTTSYRFHTNLAPQTSDSRTGSRCTLVCQAILIFVHTLGTNRGSDNAVLSRVGAAHPLISASTWLRLHMSGPLPNLFEGEHAVPSCGREDRWQCCQAADLSLAQPWTQTSRRVRVCRSR